MELEWRLIWSNVSLHECCAALFPPEVWYQLPEYTVCCLSCLRQSVAVLRCSNQANYSKEMMSVSRVAMGDLSPPPFTWSPFQYVVLNLFGFLHRQTHPARTWPDETVAITEMARRRIGRGRRQINGRMRVGRFPLCQQWAEEGSPL